MDADSYLVRAAIDLSAPGGILPAQHFALRTPLTPEKQLMLAVVREAIHCIEKYRFATDEPGRRLFREVKRWLLSEQTDWLYSFESICEALSLDAGAVRQSLLSERIRRDAPPASTSPLAWR